MKRFAVFLLVVGLAAGPACSGSQRTDTIKAALVTVDAARDGLLAYDAAHQAELVAEATSGSGARAALSSYRVSRDAATGPAGLITAAYHAIAAAAVANDDKSLAGMEAALAQLAAAIKPYLGGLK